MNIVLIAAGAGLIFIGKKLFWLCVGLIGFAFGFVVSSRLLEGEAETTIYIIAVVCGVAGGVLAFLLQKTAVRVAGFLGGAYAALRLSETLFPADTGFHWLPLTIGGIVGAVVLGVVFDWALIVLSSFVGAFLIVEGLALEGTPALIVAAVSASGGILIQSRIMRGRDKPVRRKNDAGQHQ